MGQSKTDASGARRRRLATALLAVVAALALGEAGIRLLGLAPGYGRLEVDERGSLFVASPNPALLWVPKAGTGDINAYGLREREHSVAKPDGIYRILVLGDSIGFGYCIRHLESTFAKRLETELSELVSDTRIEVLNLSVSGYETTQEVAFLREKGLDLEPDLVLVSFCLNDFDRDSVMLHRFEELDGWQAMRSRGQQALSGLQATSHLARLLSTVRFRADTKPSSTPSEGPTSSPVEAGFRELATLAEEHTFDVWVMIWPYFQRFDDYEFASLHARANRIAEKEGFPTLDLFEDLVRESEGDARTLRCDRVHPNHRGHAAAANLMAHRLAENVFHQPRSSQDSTTP